MQAHNILLLHTSSAPGMGSKGQNIFFLKVVVMHIKLKRMKHRAPRKHIVCPYTNPRFLGLGQTVKTFFSESSHVAYQIKGDGALSTMQAHIMSLHTPSVPGVGSRGQNIFFPKVVILHIKLKDMERRAYFLSLHTHLTRGVRPKSQNLFF